MLNLEPIKAREAKATPGPWRRVGNKYDSFVGIKMGEVGWEEDSTSMDPDNSEFIAAARTDIPALITEVERLRELLEATSA